MKWETLKRRVADDAASRVERCVNECDVTLDLVLSDFQVLRNLPDAQKHHSSVLSVYANQVRSVVDNWDIRCVGSLRDLFSDYFPKSLRRGTLHIDTDAKGDWVVLPT